jgi:uncharacterized membrane protein
METQLRTTVKTIIWRLICILVLAYWTGLGGSILINIFFMTLYYIHERIWLRISWGRSSHSLDQNNDFTHTDAAQHRV